MIRHVAIICLLASFALGQTTDYGSLWDFDRVVTNEQDRVALDAIPTSHVASAACVIQPNGATWLEIDGGLETLYTVTQTPVSNPDYSGLVITDFYGAFNNGGQSPYPGDVLAGAQGGPWTIDYPDGSSFTVRGDPDNGWVASTAFGDDSYGAWGYDPVQAGWFSDPNYNWSVIFAWAQTVTIVPVTNADTFVTVGSLGALLGDFYTREQIDGMLAPVSALAIQAEADAQAGLTAAGSSLATAQETSNQLALVTYGTNNVASQDFVSATNGWTATTSYPRIFSSPDGWYATNTYLTYISFSGFPGASLQCNSAPYAWVQAPVFQYGVASVRSSVAATGQRKTFALCASIDSGVSWTTNSIITLNAGVTNTFSQTINTHVPTLLRWALPYGEEGGGLVNLVGVTVELPLPANLFDFETSFGPSTVNAVTPSISTTTLAIRIAGKTYKVMLAQ